MASPPPSQICRVCKQINFAAILTPREWDGKTGRSRTIYRPEWDGNGKSPYMRWTDYAKKNRKNSMAEDYLPKIRTADYDQLSVSTQADQAQFLPWEGVGADPGKVFGEVELLADIADPPTEASGNLDVRLSEVKIEDGYVKEEHAKRVLQAEDSNDPKTSKAPHESGQTQQDGQTEPAETLVHGNQLGQQEPGNDENDPELYLILPVEESGSQPSPPSEHLAYNSDLESDEDEREIEQNPDGSPPQDRSVEWFDTDGDEDDEGHDGNDDASYTTWSGNSHFTEIQRIDLEKQARGNWEYRHGQLYYLGSIWDLRSRRHECKLCRRLWHQTRRNPDVKDEFLTKSRCIMKLMEFKGRRTDASNNEIVMLNLVYIYGYKLGDPFNSDWIVKMPFVLQGTHRDVCDLRSAIPADRMIPFDDRLFGQARKRNDTCDYGLFREWMKTCESKHDHSVPMFTDELMIRLIDVQRKCLIEWKGPTSEAPRFVALSYVWGMTQQAVMLTTDQLNESKQPGFFDRPLDQTIQDSIELVSKIEEKYLWIDSLCILQDSSEDKAHQIPQMHKIYGKAILTIVAAYGDDADAGLPGVGLGSRMSGRFNLELKDIQISFRSSTKFFAPVLDIGFVENYLRSSTYQGRAWTFQECHLSTRMLVFTKDQVYWECEKTAWCEETHWESDSIDFVGWRAVKNACPQDEWNDRFERKAYDMLGADELEKPEPPRNSYAALVKEYSNKGLSHDQDILNACTGVLSSIMEREQSDFIFALRTKHFGNDLLFNILKAIPRRFPDQTPVEAGFPTWSWLSWKGTIEVTNEARNNSYDLVEDLVPCDGVKCYMLETDLHGRKNLRVINEGGGWRFRHDYVRVGEGIYDLTHFHITRDSRGNDDIEADHGWKESGCSDTKSNEDQCQEQVDIDGELNELTTPATDEGQISGPSNLTALRDPSVTSKPQEVSSEVNEDIPEYSQDLSLKDIESHPAFSQIAPNFHIIFSTFSSTVVLRTEYDEMSIRMSRGVMAGTKKTRGGGMWENKDHIQRKIYACKKQPPTSQAPSSRPAQQGSNMAHNDETHSHGSATADTSNCPHCGCDSTPAALPDGLVLGPYLGRLPPLSTSWNAGEYIHTIPDGIYRLLWMNNNQLPMFGHLLCKPLLESVPAPGSWDGNYDGVVLQRVSAVVGPTDILRRGQQELYGAEWGVHILG